MSGSIQRLLAASMMLGATACTNFLGGDGNTLLLSEAFQTVPVGFSANAQSFPASADAGVPFVPAAMNPAAGFHGGAQASHSGGGRGHGGDRGDGMGGGLRGLLMGGGLGPDFVGALGFGRGRGRGPFGSFTLPPECAFDAESGRVTCPETERHGLAVNTSYLFRDTADAIQPAFDTLSTNSVNVKTSVSGTRTHRNSTAELAHHSDRTVTGLRPGSTQRTVNGVSVASENITGVRDSVAFTAVRVAGDTTQNLVIPVADGRPTIPTSGTVIRSMTVTVTPQGGTATTKTRREVVTFNGTNSVSVVITQDGETRNCTITLPGRNLTCE